MIKKPTSALAYPTGSIKQAAKTAVEALAPPTGNEYSFVKQLIVDTKAELTEPFRDVIVRSKVVAAVGVLTVVGAIYFLPTNWMMVVLVLFGAAVAGIGINDAFFKKWPTTVNEKKILAAQEQLDESTEKGQGMSSSVMNVILFAGLLADGYITGTALSTYLSGVTPKMAMFIGFAFAISVSLTLAMSIHFAAKAGAQKGARSTIRNLQSTNPTAADKMIARVGGALDHTFGTRSDKTAPLISLVSYTAFLAIGQTVLRIAGSMAEDGGGTIGAIVGAMLLSFVIIFTVAVAYFYARNHAYVDPDSLESKLILQKYPDVDTYHKAVADHKAEMEAIRSNTFRVFVEQFERERSERNIAKTHPIPSLT